MNRLISLYFDMKSDMFCTTVSFLFADTFVINLASSEDPLK